MNKNSVDFNVGDTVSISQHRRAPKMYPHNFYTVESSGGWVIYQMERDRDHYGSRVAWMYKFVNGEYEYLREFADTSYLTLEKKGEGTFVAGVNLPLSPYLIFKGRCEEVRQRFLETPVPTHEGFVNAATWMAHFLLTQDSRTNGYVAQMRRKDGTVNADKIKKLFSDFRLKLEDWVMEPHIEIPGDLRTISLPQRQQLLGVNWQDVSNELVANLAYA